MKSNIRAIAAMVLCFLLGLSVSAQTGTIIRESFVARSLENTVTNESSVRNVSVYLPPSYARDAKKRFPVIYLLHGIADTQETFTNAWDKSNPGFASIQDVMDSGIKENRFGEMIIVMPDERTNWFGSFYVNSAVTGNWEDYTSGELVKYIDEHYRTLARPNSRGIAGHSMGGYGALVIAMKHPDVFSVAYGLNPSIIDWGGDLTIDSRAFTFVLKAKTPDEIINSGDLYNIGVITVAQAFSPNPEKPPLYVDLPFKLVNGKLRPDEPGFSKWRENSPIRMVAKYRENLNLLRGIRFDSGYEDEFKFIPINCRSLSAELKNNGIEHTFEEYNGDHRNRIWGQHGRISDNLLPYFWRLLAH